jgi:hypothetical protein
MLKPRSGDEGRVDPGRDLNDVNYNRLWEYANHS